MLNDDYFLIPHTCRGTKIQKQKLEQNRLYQTARHFSFFSENLFLDRNSISPHSIATVDQRQGCNHFYVKYKWVEIFIWVVKSVHSVKIINTQ